VRRAALVLAAVLLLAGSASAATRDEAFSLWQSILTAEDVPTDWTGSTAGCVRGTESAQSIDATRTAVNALRRFAGLPPVTFDPVKNDKALAAALMMDAANDLSHTPDENWPCSTPEGREAAGHSNLALGITGAKAMVGYVEDASVASLGHRRWVLDPGATVFGTGSTAKANALWVIPDGAPTTQPGAPELVAWPPAGSVPWPLVFDAWSAAWAVPGVDVSNAQVAVTVDGQPRTVSNTEELFAGFGSAEPTLVWNVALTAADRSADHALQVTISGATRDGAPYPVEYTINTFVATPPTIGKVSYSRNGPRRAGAKVTVSAVVEHAVSVAYQWLRDGKAIAGATRKAYRLRQADRGHRIRCRVTATGIGTATKLGPKLRVRRR
jgi:uncharacterized protein YkwD